ncbi:MAG TPA: protein kinase [Vicinamibacterales bacterium]|nr:protein kinase [Vicinamibacterales bacterium]
MPLTAGNRLGAYEIVAALGAGGMGEVYQARDTRLGREVAIKSLPDLALGDPERIARFEREAQILGSLNHPHIATLYGLEESDGARFLVMELVDGGTLADRLARGKLSLPVALGIARQVAEALEAAHDKGIVHRDLKPANIALSGSGQVKILDFGLAKALDRHPDDQVTALAATQTGVVLGTAGYMSPEQARGASIDKRSDIWAFGCVLYELLTGRHPFPGRTITDTIAAIVTTDPDWTALPPETPRQIRWLARRCLEKDPRRRLHDIADARIELEDAAAEPAGSDQRAATSSGPPTSAAAWKRDLVAWSLAGAGLLVLLWSVLGTRDADATGETPPVTAAVMLQDGLNVSLGNPPGRLALSPDGSKLAIVAADAPDRTTLWIRPLDSRLAQPLAGTENASFPFWSPDGRSIAFLASGKLKKIDVAGGAPVTLADAALPSRGTWNKDDVILFTPAGGSPIYRVSASGGTPAQLTTLDAAAGDTQHWYPSFLPDGHHFLYFVVGSKARGMTDPRAIYIGSLDPDEAPKLLVEGGSNAVYANGHVVYLREGTLVARPFDPDRLEFTGEPLPIVEQVQIAGAGTTGVAGAFSVSDAGLLAYQTGFQVRSQLAWFDRTGREIGKLGDLADYADVSLSPEGSRAAVSVLDPALGTRDVWIYDVVRKLRERFTFNPGDDFAPVWSRPDGARIFFSSRRQASIHLYQQPSRGGEEELLYEDALGKFASHVSPSGSHLVYIAGGGIIRRSDLWAVSLDKHRKAFPILDSAFVESHAQVSRDGRWLAYMADESDQFQVYVRPFPGPGDKTQVSPAGGGWPRWSHDGSEIVYLAPDNTLMSVPVSARGSVFIPGEARKLFRIQPRRGSRLDAYQYDLSPDSQRILVNMHVEEATSAPITLIVNWPATLRRSSR